jgi:hypothetical protein
MSLNWEKATLVAATKEITGSICKIYAEANTELTPTSFGRYIEGGVDVIHQTTATAITVPAGTSFEGPIVRTKTDANVVIVYHNGPLIIK